MYRYFEPFCPRYEAALDVHEPPPYLSAGEPACVPAATSWKLPGHAPRLELVTPFAVEPVYED